MLALPQIPMAQIAAIPIMFTTPAMSAAQKYVTPVLPFEGEPLVHPQTRQPITDWQGNPVGRHGIVITTMAGKVIEKVDGVSSETGDRVVIMNQATSTQAKSLAGWICRNGGIPATLTEWKKYLAHARRIGLRDVYGSDRSFIRDHMTLVDPGFALVEGGQSFGFMKRDSRDVWRAVFVLGAFTYAGTAGEQNCPNGGVIVISPDGRHNHAVQPQEFIDTYLLESGGKIDSLEALPQSVRTYSLPG